MNENTLVVLALGYFVVIVVCFRLLSNPKACIKCAVILRLLGNCALSLGLAVSFSDEYQNIRRVYFNREKILWVAVAALIVDSLATILWLRGKRCFQMHLIAYILLGGYAYVNYSIVALDLSGMASLVAFIFAPFLMIAGLIPMIAAGMAFRRITKAQKQELAGEAAQGNFVNNE